MIKTETMLVSSHYNVDAIIQRFLYNYPDAEIISVGFFNEANSIYLTIVYK